MKKIGEIILIVITVAGIPSIIQLAFPHIYDSHSNSIWIMTIVLCLLLSLIQINFNYSPSFNRFIRKFRFYIFKTKNIAAFFIFQIIVTLIVLIFKAPTVNLKFILVSFGINLLGLNLLILIGKISNTDIKELVFHNPTNGAMYLYSNNELRHIPDPPTFDLLGLSWSDAIDITKKDLDSYKISAPITSLSDMKLLR